MEQLDRMSLEDKVFAGDASMTSAKNKMLIRDAKKELMRYDNERTKNTWSDLKTKKTNKKNKTWSLLLISERYTRFENRCQCLFTFCRMIYD